MSIITLFISNLKQSAPSQEISKILSDIEFKGSLFQEIWNHAGPTIDDLLYVIFKKLS